jgi:hypothetical protein
VSDAFTSSFITVDGAGNVGAIFPGTIVAGNIKVGDLSEISGDLGTITAGKIIGAELEDLGELVLSEGNTEEGSTESKVQWKGGGFTREMISGTFAGGTHMLQIWSNVSAGSHGQVNIRALGEQPTLFERKAGRARVTVDAAEVGSIEIGATQKNATAELARLLFDSQQRSDFLQLLATGKRRLAFGESTCGWVAGNHLSNTTVVNHGLSAVPLLVLVTPYQSESETHIAIFNVLNYTETTFSVNGYWPGVGPGNNSFKWIAIG